MSGTDLNRSTPVIDFTSLDAESFLADIVSYAQATFSDKWTDFNEGQIGRAMTEILAYQFDLGTFYLNALLNETNVETALRRQSLIDISKRLDYRVPSAGAATVDMELVLNPAGAYPFTLSAITHKVSNASTTDQVIFMPISDVTVPAYVATITVPFVEGNLVSETLGTSTGLRNQRFVLAQRPMIDGTLTLLVNGVEWTLRDHAVDQTAADESYLVETDEANNTTVIFGDNVNGKIPTVGFVVTASYKIGGGRRGNLGHDTITTKVTMPAQVTSVTNPDPSTGGAPSPSNDAIRRAAPAAMRVHSGIINDLDMKDAALLVSGVAKARAFPGNPLTRVVNLVVAPAGGGAPTDTLKNQVQMSLKPNKMIGQRVGILDPVYKDIEVTLRLFARSGARVDEITTAATTALTNSDKTGYGDFDQVDFAGLDVDDEPTFSETRMVELMDAVSGNRWTRSQLLALTVRPAWRTFGPILGNGTVTSIATTTNDNRRREYLITMTSATTFTVVERIIGIVRRVEDKAIIDDTQDFVDSTFQLGLVAYGMTTLNPDRRQSTTFTVASSSTTRIQTTVGGLYLLAEPGSEYYVQKSRGTGTAGTPFVVTDPIGQTLVQFTVTVGSTPFAAGDVLAVDVYPPVGDIVLRSDEIPSLDVADITIKVAGGIQT